jgi:tRNA G46 methylase TrmB
VQVASFAAVLWQLLGGWGQDGGAMEATVVDFGCGSGNLILPLASMFPKCTFIGNARFPSQLISYFCFSLHFKHVFGLS